MKTIVVSKIVRKVLILTFLVIGLVFIASSNKTAQPVQAAYCCETCDGRRAECYAQGGSYTYCNNRWTSCVGQCTYCGLSDCTNESGCPIGYVCDYGYCRFD